MISIVFVQGLSQLANLMTRLFGLMLVSDNICLQMTYHGVTKENQRNAGRRNSTTHPLEAGPQIIVK